ncbi:MAG: MarR family transcriptional regulator [Chloroflexi bacterium]|uniref:MarR family winged helix-turn-helix transcriptional regulator n=1 Tax=Candidatus Flexifilum breve TaxID=3140694 RepID=UPI0031368D96|nr:MarR family transcriptional regulator [Chloroflexota bacterium]
MRGLERDGFAVGQEMISRAAVGRRRPIAEPVGGALCVEPPTVTKMLTRMERGGLVERRADAADARVSCVYLTDTSRNLHTHVNAAWIAGDEHAARSIPTNSAFVLRNLLQRSLANLAAE